MSTDKMDTLSLAELMAIAAGAIKNLLPNGDRKAPAKHIDCASI